MDSAAELTRKLGVKPDSIVVALNANPYIVAKLQDGLPERASLLAELPTDSPSNTILVWLAENNDLYKLFQRLRRAVTPDGAIWAIIPKKKTRENKASSVTFELVQDAALKTDLVDNKVLSFSAEEYGIRFVVRKEKRGE
jgi:uncharacterized protein (UPF0128 family)